MFKQTKRIPSEWGTLLLGVALVIFGIYTLAKPFKSLAALTGIVALFVLIRGVLLVLEALMEAREAKGSFLSLKFAIGVACIVVGFIFWRRPMSLRFAVVAMLAVWFLLDALDKVRRIWPARKASPPAFTIVMVMAAIVLSLCAVLLISHSVASLSTFTLVGLILLVSGANQIYTSLLGV